jgi:hypothetical protein
MTLLNFADKSTSGIDEDALSTTIPGERVFNFGRLTTTGDLANGIFGEADGVAVRNFGRIETSGLGAAGILVRGDDAQILNFGSVSTHGTFLDPDPTVEGEESFAEGITAEGDRFNIVNFGRVHVDGEFSSCMSGVGANGVVINFGVADSAATGSSVIAVIGDGSRAVNAGRVTVRGTDNAALFALGEEASATNLGVIMIGADDNAGIEGVIENTNLSNKGLIRIDGDGGSGIAAFGAGHQISNSGRIEAHGDFSDGIEARGSQVFDIAGIGLEVNNSGHITTDGGLGFGIALGLGGPGFFPAENSIVVNSGVIGTQGDGAAGVIMCGSDNQLINSGRIVADGGEFDSDTFGLIRAAAVVVSGDDALIQNCKSGVILSKDADAAAVELNIIERDGLSNADTSCRLENYGLIKGAGLAVLGGAGDETVVNHGRIIGDVQLGDGADTFVSGKGGSVAGSIFLGGGDDIVFIEDGSGTTRIADFAAGSGAGDFIDVSSFFSNFAALISQSSQVGSDTVIALDGNDCLVLQNTLVGTLNEGDFQFA